MLQVRTSFLSYSPSVELSNMFGFLFGWRKASNCKKLIKQLQCRLKLLKNKRCSMVRLLREDLAELIKTGHAETAFSRAEQLFQDENIMAVYELLDSFCQFISMNISYIRKRKDIPNDINEAVSSLVFASVRCGQLPELRVIRKLFEERYGQRFAVDTAEFFPGNLLNFQIKERLSITSVPDDVKLQLLDEIAREYCLKPELLALENNSELQQVLENSVYQGLDNEVYTCHSRGEECHWETSNADKIQDFYVDSLLTSTKAIRLNQSSSHFHKNSDAVSTSFSSSIVQQSSLDAPVSPMIDKAEKVENAAQFDSQIGFTVAGEHTKEKKINDRKNTAPSSESLPQFHDERLVYLDEIEELQSSMRKDGDCQDQRLFKFKQSMLPKPDTADGCNESYRGQYESFSKKSSSRSSRKTVTASGKQPRRQLLSQESSGIKDMECEIYYEKPYKSPASRHRSHHHMKQQKKSAVEESKQPCCIDSGTNFQMRLCCHCHFSCEFNNCSLENSCYCCIDDEEKEREFLRCKLQVETRKFVGYPIYDLQCDHRRSFEYRLTEGIEKPSVPQKPRRTSYDNGATEYNAFTNANRWLKEQIMSTNGNVKTSDSPRKEAASQIENKPKPPYLTVKTMPPERTKENCADNILRCSSFPCQYPDHVHPKLPDYDVIAAKFMALKKERLQNKCC